MAISIQVDGMKQLLKHPQFYWWCGHVYFFINSLLYFISVLSFHSNVFYYRQAYLGALLSYSIVSFRSIGIPHRFQLDIFRDENIQYLALAFYWYSYLPMIVTLIPFFVYSIFHILDYTQSILLPTILPTTSATTENHSIVHKIKDQIKHIVEEKNDLALYISAYSEVVLITIRLMVGILLYQTSILAFIVFTHFLRLRYFVSPHTQHALHQSTLQLDHFLVPSVHNQFHPSVPRWVTKFYLSLKDIISRYGGSIHPTTSTASTTTANDQHQE